MTRAQLGAWSLVVLGTVYLTVAGGGAFFGLYVGGFRFLSLIVALGAIGAWLAWAARHPEWRPRTSLWPAIVACVAAMVVSAATAPEPRLAFDFIAYAVLLTGLYLLMQRLLGHPLFGRRLAVLGILLGFGLASLYIGAIFIHWLDFWRDLGRFSTPPLRPDYEGLSYGNPSTIATVTVLLWLAAAAHLGFSTGRRRTVLGVLGVLTAGVVFLSGSRGAWAGLAIAVVLIVPIWLAMPAHRLRARQLLADRRVRVGAIAAAVTVTAVTVLFLPALISRLTEPASETRTAFYQASIRMFLDRPLTGLGPGNWTVERPHYTVPPELDYYIPHAHSIWLQTLAELGLVGAVGGAVMLLSVAALLRRGIRSGDPLQGRLAWAAIAGIVYLGAHQLFDFYPNMPAIGFCLALTVARLDAMTETVDRQPAPFRSFRIVAAALIVLTAGSGLWLARSEAASTFQDRATHAANAGDWSAAREDAGQALAIDPDMPPYLFTSGLAAAHLGDLEAARDLMVRSARRDDFPTAWLNVARLEADLGDAVAARDALERAMRLGDQQPQVALGAATIEEELGDHPAAVRALTSAFLVAPGMVSDPYWSDPSRAALFSDALSRALSEAAPQIGYQLALEAGRIEDARAIAATLPAADREAVLLEIEAWAGDEAAFDALHAIARDDPLHDELVARCRRVAARSHDADWAGPGPWTCDGAGFVAALIVIRVSPPPTTRAILPGPNASWHVQYTYRRTSPADELVPGLPHLAVVFV